MNELLINVWSTCLAAGKKIRDEKGDGLAGWQPLKKFFLKTM